MLIFTPRIWWNLPRHYWDPVAFLPSEAASVLQLAPSLLVLPLSWSITDDRSCSTRFSSRASETWKHDCDREEDRALPRGRADSLPANEIRVRVLPLRQTAVPPAEAQVRTEVSRQQAPSETPVLHSHPTGNRGAGGWGGAGRREVARRYL